MIDGRLPKSSHFRAKRCSDGYGTRTPSRSQKFVNLRQQEVILLHPLPNPIATIEKDFLGLAGCGWRSRRLHPVDESSNDAIVRPWITGFESQLSSGRLQTDEQSCDLIRWTWRSDESHPWPTNGEELPNNPRLEPPGRACRRLLG